MGSRVRISCLVILLLVVSISSFNCNLPFLFEVTALEVSPKTVSPGDPVTITATVTNYGIVEGLYPTILMVDGSFSDGKVVAVKPGESETVIFNLSKDKLSDYNIQVGRLSTTQTVKRSQIKNAYELKNDDNTARFNSGAYHRGGYIIDFEPPVKPFTISSIKILAHTVYRNIKEIEGESFDLQLLDQDLKLIYSEKYPFTLFPYADAILEHSWKEFNIPNVQVSGKFYVHVYSYSKKISSLIPIALEYIGPIGLMLASGNYLGGNSTVTTMEKDGTVKLETTWWKTQRYSNLNWMIRIIGTGMTEE